MAGEFVRPAFSGLTMLAAVGLNEVYDLPFAGIMQLTTTFSNRSIRPNYSAMLTPSTKPQAPLSAASHATDQAAESHRLELVKQIASAQATTQQLGGSAPAGARELLANNSATAASGRSSAIYDTNLH